MSLNVTNNSPPPPAINSRSPPLNGWERGSAKDNDKVSVNLPSDQDLQPKMEVAKDGKRRRGNGTPSPENSNSHRSKIKRGTVLTNRPLTTQIDRDFKKAMRELGGQVQHSVKPNLGASRRTPQVSQPNSATSGASNQSSSVASASKDTSKTVNPPMRGINSPFKTAIKNRFSILENIETNDTDSITSANSPPAQSNESRAKITATVKPAKPFNS